ncbi:MAG: alpha/beta hydrolase [Xanthobacteraceae bacterium]|uniref:alpha/beta hydrolase n=1 Tax=Pseudolabrys sp. TaxID=1960880 RepID=UPI003D0FF31C
MSDSSPSPSPAKGPPVWLDMDQAALDAAYDQTVYAPTMQRTLQRYASRSEETRARLGAPRRIAYGPSAIERFDLYPAKTATAPIFVFAHGGAWLRGEAKNYGFPAEMFVDAGAHYIALDFITITEANGDLAAMAAQVRRAVAWIYRNAGSFGGDAGRLYLGGHSSGAHLAGVTMVTDWPAEFGLPADTVKGGLLMSGMYDMKPVRLSKRNSYVTFTDAMEHAMSAQRQIDRLHAPVTISYGTRESPEFQRQSCDFAAAVTAAGKPATLIAAADFDHFEICETLGNPYGPNGRAALTLMKLV